jgi:hypothetical protein
MSEYNDELDAELTELLIDFHKNCAVAHEAAGWHSPDEEIQALQDVMANAVRVIAQAARRYGFNAYPEEGEA